MPQQHNTTFIPSALQQWEQFTRKIPPFAQQASDVLSKKFSTSTIHSEPPPPTDASDVVIAGGGPVNMQYALGLLARGIDVTILEPYPGETTKALTVSREIFDIGCRNFNRDILTRSVDFNCGNGAFTIYPHTNPDYVAAGVLDQSINAEHFLSNCISTFTTTTGSTHNGRIIVDKLDHFTRWNDHTYAITEGGRVVQTHLLLHNTGVNDSIFRIFNQDLDIDFFPIVGVEAEVLSRCPSGSLFDTIDFSDKGPFGTAQALWEFLADKHSPVEESRKAVIYLFIRTFEETDMPALIEYFFRNLHRYGNTRLVTVHRFLMDHAAVIRDADTVRRSAADGVRVIGPWDFTNNFSGAPFEEHLKAAYSVIDKLAAAVHKRRRQMTRSPGSTSSHQLHTEKNLRNPLHSSALEKIRVDRLQRASSKMGRAMCRAIMHLPNEPRNAVGHRMSELLSLYSGIDNVPERNRMLYNIIHPGMVARFIALMARRRKVTTIISALMSVNSDFPDVLGDLVRCYSELLRVQLFHICKHSGALFLAICHRVLFPKSYVNGSCTDQILKLKQHAAVISGSAPLTMGVHAAASTLAAKRIQKKAAKAYHDI